MSPPDLALLPPMLSPPPPPQFLVVCVCIYMRVCYVHICPYVFQIKNLVVTISCVCYRALRHLPLQLSHQEMRLVKTTPRLLGWTTFSTPRVQPEEVATTPTNQVTDMCDCCWTVFDLKLCQCGYQRLCECRTMTILCECQTMKILCVGGLLLRRRSSRWRYRL